MNAQKILGLDLGSASIGWAIIEKGGNNTGKVVDMGVRVVPLSSDESEEFNKGQSVSTNAQRRMSRGARRNNQRFKLRRDQLRKILKNNNMLPDKQGKPLNNIETYKLRSKAAIEKVELEDLGKVFMMINSKRGYQSNRKANSGDNDTDYLKRISDNDRVLVENNITIGQHFYQKLKNYPHYRIKDQIFSRKSYINEFEQIWKTQSEHYPSLTEDLKREIVDTTIFYQRKLKSQKHLISRCPFYPKLRAVPVSSPLFQEFRIWQKIHQLKAFDNEFSEVEISEEQKEQLYLKLSEKEKLSDKGIKKVLGLKGKNSGVNLSEIKGNSTVVRLKKAFERAKIDTLEILDFDWSLKGDDFHKQPLMQLWHKFHSIEDEEALINSLIDSFGFTKDQAKVLAPISLESGYGSLSSRAIRKLLNYMAYSDGLPYELACLEIGVRHSQYLTKGEQNARKYIDKLQVIKKGELRNPVVEKILNQMIHVVNDIIDEYGKPDAIHVELARELKSNIKERKRAYQENNRRQKENRRIVEEVKKYGVVNPSIKDIQRYKLAEETNFISLYSGKPISPVKLFTTNEYDIEHIIPRARLFDDSFLNKTICESKINREKDKETAIDFFESKGSAPLEEFINRVKNSNIHPVKMKKLLTKGKDISDDFIERQMRETQYITKAAKDLLGELCKDIILTTGQITSHLRLNWGLEEVMKEVNLHRIEKDLVNVTKGAEGERRYRIDGWTKRDDHRHHAIDALIVSCTTRSFIQKLNSLNSSYIQGNGVQNYRPDVPWPNFRKEVILELKKLLVSQKSSSKVLTKSINKISRKNGAPIVQETLTPRGRLHEETVYGKIKLADRKIPFDKRFKKEEIRLICSDKIRQEVREFINRFPSYKAAMSELKKNPLTIDGKPLEGVRCYSEYYVKRDPINESLNVEMVVDPAIRKILSERLAKHNKDKKKAFSGLDTAPIKLSPNGPAIRSVRVKAAIRNPYKVDRGYVVPGSNHHVALYQDNKGKVHFEKRTFFEAVQLKLEGQSPYITNHKNGWEYLFHVKINDFFVFFSDELGEDVDIYSDENRALVSDHLYRVQKVSVKHTGQPDIWFRHHLETQVTRNSSSAFINVQSYRALNAVKVSMDRLGKISPCKAP